VYGIILLLVLTAQPGAVAQNFSYKTLFMFGDPDLSTGVNPSGSLALGKDGRLLRHSNLFFCFWYQLRDRLRCEQRRHRI